MIDKAARQLGIDRIAIRKINAPDANGKIGKERGPLTSAFQKDALDKVAVLVQLERAQEDVRPEERQQGDRHRYRPGLSFGRHQRL